MHSVFSAARQNDPNFESTFETLNLTVKDRFNKFINSTVFKYFTKQFRNYLNEIFELACPNKSRTGNAYLKLNCPFRKTNTTQNPISLIGPTIWNKIPEVLKKTPTALILSNIT